MFNLFKKKEEKFTFKTFDIDDFYNELDSYKPTVFDKIRWKFKDIKSAIRGIPTGIKNIIKWMPIIWRDRDFDQSYIFDVILFKFKNMEKFFRSEDTWSADALIYADDIKKARELLEYISNTQYEEDGMKPYYDKFPLGVKNPEKETEESRKLFWDCQHECERLYQEKMKEFCDLFTERVRYWWD